MRSALMGALEGLLRDQMLARTSRFPATYTEADYRTIFATFLSAFAARPPLESSRSATDQALEQSKQLHQGNLGDWRNESIQHTPLIGAADALPRPL